MNTAATGVDAAFDRAASRIARFGACVAFLFRHPGRFSRCVAPRLGRLWLVLMTISYGLELSMSGLARDAGRPEPRFAPATWPEWWGWALGLSLFSGILVAALGDAFFRLRVALSGARWPESGKLTRVYLSLAQIGVVPAVLCKLGETFYFASPAEAAGFALPSLLVGGVFAIWGQVGEYRATVMAFGAAPRRARLVFVGFPIAVGFLLVVLVRKLL